jgi:hypothetical protein
MCHSMTPLPDGRILLLGGRQKEGICKDMWWLDAVGWSVQALHFKWCCRLHECEVGSMHGCTIDKGEEWEHFHPKQQPWTSPRAVPAGLTPA